MSANAESLQSLHEDYIFKFPRAEEQGYPREEYERAGSEAHKNLVLVMRQTFYDQESCIRALLHHGGDIVNAIMELTY